MPGIAFSYAYYDTDKDSFAKHLDEDAAAHAEKLARSERGTTALRTLSEWLATGGIGLDQTNQQAVLALLCIAWRRPSAADNAIIRALTK